MSHACTPLLTPFSALYSTQAQNLLESTSYFEPDTECNPPLAPVSGSQNPNHRVDLPPYPSIDSLPNEILSHIFESGYFEGERLDHDFRSLLENVSQRWRDAAHYTPSLWSIYHLSQGNLDHIIDDLPLFLERSGEYPLEIHLNCFWDLARTTDVMELFLPHSKRWHSLSITTPGADIFRYLQYVPVPQLQSLQICHFSSRRDLPIDPELFTDQLPSLRHLSIRNISFRGTTLPLRALWSLDVSGYGVWPEFDELNELIGGSTELKELTLHIRPEKVLEDLNPPHDQQIILPALRTFNTTTSEGLSPHLTALCRLFVCPSIDSFIVKNAQSSPTSELLRYSRTGSAIYPEPPVLRIRACNLYHAWCSLNSSQNIVTLELNDVRWPHWSNCMTVFAAMSSLQNMVIASVDPTAALSELGNSSRPLKLKALKKLEIGINRQSWDGNDKDFAGFMGTFETPKLRSLALRNVSWQQWNHFVLSLSRGVSVYSLLDSLTITNLYAPAEGCTLSNPSSAFPNLHNFTIFRSTSRPLLEHLICASDRPGAVPWPRLKNLAICDDSSADAAFLRQIIVDRVGRPITLLLDTNFQRDPEHWRWLEKHADVVLIPTVNLW